MCDIGAYLPWSLVVPLLSVTCIPGPYKLRNFSAVMDVAYTHRVPVAPVRGAGRIQSVFIMERALDHIADRLGKDPAEIRHKNYIQPDDFPYEVGLRARDGSIMTYDSGRLSEAPGNGQRGLGVRGVPKGESSARRRERSRERNLRGEWG